MRGSQKAKHEEGDPVQHNFEGFLQNSPMKDGGKGMFHCEMSGVWMGQDCTSATQDKVVGMGRQQGSQGGRSRCLGALSAGPVGRPQSPTIGRD